MGLYECLEVKATQAAFAALLGISQQAISKRVNDGTLESGATLLAWLQAYCDKLREEAAGRSGDDQKGLTKARTADAMASVELKFMQIKEKAGELALVSELEPQWAAMVIAARTELLSLPDKIANEVKALHGIDIDASLIEANIYEVLNHLADRMQDDSAFDDKAGGESMAPAA